MHAAHLGLTFLSTGSVPIPGIGLLSCSVEFLPPSSTGDPGPFAAFGGPDGAIRVLSLSTWQFVKKLTGGHKGAVHCLLPFIAGNGEVNKGWPYRPVP